ncbi:MAG: DUF4956 domain-containing protein [Cyclobacteriaceae bacterium]|jgi:hypothetical protein|nr:DUF4956 domain-containing protein [Cyclobacteriaceae bacterium]
MEKGTLFTEYLLIRLCINTATMVLLVRYIYYHIYNKRDFFFTFYLINFIVFLLAYMLNKSSAFVGMSAAFGLLAAFSLLRFRTESMSTKDMTYIFIVMTLGLINSSMDGQYFEIIGINLMILTAVYFVDGGRFMRNQKTKTLEYQGLENIHPEKQYLLIKDLKERTGLNIQRISIEHIDLIKERIEIKIYYH